MLRIHKMINRHLSVRLSLIVVSSMALLLMASLIVMLYFSRKAIKEEALQKAKQTLEATVERIDNILLSVEQSTGNFFFTMYPNFSQADMMETYCRRLVESNPYIVGSVMAFKPGYFPGREGFMVYFHRENLSPTSETIIEANTRNNMTYTKERWYTHPMKVAMPGWQTLMSDGEIGHEPIITFCLPIPGPDGHPVGIMSAGVSLSLLSHIVEAAKPSPNSYCTLLDKDGSYIVHPNSNRLINETIYTQLEGTSDPSAKEAAEAMISGETGYKDFSMYGTDYYVFYTPFKRTAIAGRAMEKLGWSAGIIYPEDDIFGDYNSLTYYVLAIAVIGLLLIFLLSRQIIHIQLKPLLMLTESAQRIAKGNYSEVIPNSRHKDEIGQLQGNFQKMQQSLGAYIGKLEQLTSTLEERDKSLRVAYVQAQKADRMKTAFLHNMTNQMVGPAEAINNDVEALVHGMGHTTVPITQRVDDILQNGNTITELLNNLISVSDEDMRKEAAHD